MSAGANRVASSRSSPFFGPSHPLRRRASSWRSKEAPGILLLALASLGSTACAPADPPESRSPATNVAPAPTADGLLARLAEGASPLAGDWNGINHWADPTGRLRKEEAELLPRVLEGGARDSARLGRVYVEAGETARAQWFLTRALAADGGDPETWVQLGKLLLLQGEPREALVPFARAKELNFDFTSAFVYSGDAYARLGDAQAARIEYEAALERNPGRLEARIALARLLEDAGELDAARAQLERAVLDDPDSPTALYRLARVSRALGLDAEAAEIGRRHERAAILEDLRLRDGAVPRASALLALGAHFLSDGRVADAAREFASARDLAESPEERAAALAGLLRCARAGIGDADALARALAEIDPEHPLLRE